MPTQRIFDASGGVVSTVTYDDLTKKVTYAQYQDHRPYLERNKRLRELNPYMCGGDVRRVASIPNIVLLKMLREDGIPPLNFFRNHRAYSKWLEGKIYSSDYCEFLTAPHSTGPATGKYFTLGKSQYREIPTPKLLPAQ